MLKHGPPACAGRLCRPSSDWKPGGCCKRCLAAPCLAVGYLPFPRGLKVCGAPSESIQLVSLVVCEDKYAPPTTIRDFNNLSMKCTKIGISAYPPLPDEKLFHFLARVLGWWVCRR